MIVSIAICWLLGLFLSQYVQLPPLWPLVAASLAALAAAALRVRPLPRRFARLSLPLLLFSVTLLGLARPQLAESPAEPPDQVAALAAGDGVEFTGTVQRERRVTSGGYAAYELTNTSVKSIDSSENPLSVSGTVKLFAPAWTDWLPQTVLQGTADIALSLDPGQSGYREPKTVVLTRVEAREIGAAPDASPLAWFSGIRTALANALGEALPQPQAGIAQGMLVGVRSQIDSGLARDFNASGLSHILVVSGFNISLLAACLVPLTRGTKRRALSLTLCSAAIVAYGLLVGPGPSTLRAVIMGLILLYANLLGRPSLLVPGLATAALVMTAVEPNLLWDVSFQLSSMATLGLGVITPRLESALRFLPGWLRTVVATTGGAQLATLPIIATNFGVVSAVALLTNVLALPSVPLATVLSGLTAFGQLIWPPLGMLLGWIDWLFLSLVLAIAQIGAKTPGAILATGDFSGPICAGYYAVLGTAYTFWTRHPVGSIPGTVRDFAGRRLVLVPLLLAASLVWLAVLTSSRSDFSLTFMDVGQGDAILIEAGSTRVLVDGGPDPLRLSSELDRRLPFWDSRIDVVVASHAHNDHVGGLVGLGKRHSIGEVLAASEDTGGAYGVFLEETRKSAVPIANIKAGDRLDLSPGVRIEVLDLGNDKSDPTNDQSIVLRLVWNDQSFLLTGDAGPTQRSRLVKSGFDLRGDLLKVPHHGAKDALDESFLEAVQPQFSVVSVGRNTFGHPASSTLTLLEGTQAFRTDIDGTIEVFGRDGTLWVKTAK